jgi:hypothetical protein
MGTRARPLVTIGISTYKRANSYLPAALLSALDQTLCLQQARRVPRALGISV